MTLIGTTVTGAAAPYSITAPRAQTAPRVTTAFCAIFAPENERSTGAVGF